MVSVREIRESLLHYVFPHVCSGCGTDVLNKDSSLCIRCLHALPTTHFELYPSNPVEKIFWGRVPLHAASAQFYFTKDSLIQRLMHQFKYKQNKEVGIQLGRMMGNQLLQSDRFNVDALIPLPLFPSKERKRGYNQAAVLCDGMSEIMKIPVLRKLVMRSSETETQTKKGRIDRWQNMEGRFLINETEHKYARLLLVDDVITTGATLEFCAEELFRLPGVQLSAATLCVASR